MLGNVVVVDGEARHFYTSPRAAEAARASYGDRAEVVPGNHPELGEFAAEVRDALPAEWKVEDAWTSSVGAYQVQVHNTEQTELYLVFSKKWGEIAVGFSDYTGYGVWFTHVADTVAAAFYAIWSDPDGYYNDENEWE